MIYKGTKLKVIDNSGAALIECIHVAHPRAHLYGKVAAPFIASVKKLKKSVEQKKVKKGQVVFALLITSKSPLKRVAGGSIRAYSNHSILISKDDSLPLSNRINGYVAFENRINGRSKIISISKGVY